MYKIFYCRKSCLQAKNAMKFSYYSLLVIIICCHAIKRFAMIILGKGNFKSGGNFIDSFDERNILADDGDNR